LHQPFAYIPVVMTSPDSERERQRLAAWYAAKSDEELTQLASDASALTEVAQATLRAAISRRGLDIPLVEKISADEAEHFAIITIRRYRDIPAALLAKSILDSAGIENFLTDVNTVRMDWLWSNALGGVRLFVKDSDASAAEELLNQSFQDSFEVEGQERFTQPRCPVCQSFEVSYKGLHKRIAYASIILQVPIPLSRLGWRCSSCGHMWEDADDVAAREHDER
jgi:Putative prokaryotic signal transducing protein